MVMRAIGHKLKSFFDTINVGDDADGIRLARHVTRAPVESPHGPVRLCQPYLSKTSFCS